MPENGDTRVSSPPLGTTVRKTGGQSMLFLIVVTTFIVLVSSSIVYSGVTKRAIERHSDETALAGLMSVMEMTYPAAKVLAQSQTDPSGIFSDFCESLQSEENAGHSLPFLLEADGLAIAEESRLPPGMSEMIAEKFQKGDFTTHSIRGIPYPSWVCRITSGGRVWLAAASPLSGTDMMLGLVQDTTPYTVHARRLEQVLIGFLALGYMSFLALLVLVLKIITDPLKTLTRAAGQFARGDLNTRVEVPRTVSEVRLLAEAFNHMGSELKSQRDSLEAYSRELEHANKNHQLDVDELSRRSRELERINQIFRRIAGDLNMDHLLREVLEFTRSSTHAECAFIGLLDGGSMHVRHISPSDMGVDPLETDTDYDELLSGKIRAGQPFLIHDINEKGQAPADGFIRRHGFQSVVGVPISRKGDPVGVLCCLSHGPQAFMFTDQSFLGLLASQVGIALDNARLFEEIMTRDMRRDMQLKVAQKLQKDRMPENFKQNVAALNCKLRPAEELAGDFCDVFPLGRNSIALVIGDVANKGVAASLMAFSLLSMFRNVAKTHKPPCEVLRLINRALISQIKEDGWFATAFYAKLNTSTGILTYASAGHEMPLWFHADTGEVEMLDVAGYPLGLFSYFDFETREIQMKIGDRLVLYTDGVTDAVDSLGNRFGHHALMELTVESGKLSHSDFAETVIRKVEERTGNLPQRDDIIVAVLELQDDPWIHRTIAFRDSADLITEIMDALAPYNLDAQVSYAIRLAVDEAMANAWRHGVRLRDDVPFDVSYLISDQGFQLRVRDSGSGFDHESLPDPTVEENLFKSHGRGVFLIRQVMDDVEFNEAGNEIMLAKRFTPGGEIDETNEQVILFDSVPALRLHQESLERARKASPGQSSQDDESEQPVPSSRID